MKRGFSVYLSPELMAQLTAFAKRERQPKSLVAETAIVSFLAPDDADRREAAVSRRLDQLTRQVDRLERDITVSVEALTVFIRFWLTVTPSLPDTAQAAAQAKGRERFDSFLQALGRRLSKGQTLWDEISSDRSRTDASANGKPQQ